ncbi:MAG TPA: hypothetical protein VN025_09650 [Candidatus Dormibacteraeota bacterium]|nr:hypothetical protein [Candidatus Dormibacteraeota bacterium]
MKKIMVSLLTLPFLLSGVAAGQSQSADKSSGKTVSIFGKLSEDGKSFLAKHGQVWTIANPEAVSGQAGHELKLKCRLLSAAHQVQVLAVKEVAAQVRFTANPSDSAFRR